jgi:copper chaperone CopZ
METIKFKTTIKCSGCLAKVTPHLNEALGEHNWDVDITVPSKVLTVAGQHDETKVMSTVERAGFKAEKLN